MPWKSLASGLRLPFLLLVALSVRSVGLYRGLEQGDTFHPDTTKQVQATRNFLAGHYLWYTGSLAYDGYPYGLNQVDDALIRLGRPVVRGVWETLHPGRTLPRIPDRVATFHLLRTFRVLYSLLALACLAWALRRGGLPDGERFVWLLLAALAPLSSTVTHDASGDVGTDLFAMLALALLAHGHRQVPGPLPFLGAGLAVGMGFACKYHGALVALSPGLFLLLAPLAWRRRFQLGAWLAAGGLGGFVLLTPQLFIRFGKTLKNIRLNFTYIRRYGVAPEFWEQSKSQQLLESLADNLPTTAWALGSGLLLLALLGALLVLREHLRQRGTASAWTLAVLAMPFAVILLATTGKPRLQPFHFSFLPLPLILGAALAWRKRPPRLRPIFPLLLGFSLLDQTRHQAHEWTFWSREDTRQVAFRLSEELLHPSSESRTTQHLATLAVEGPNLSVFRNGPRPLRLADARAWQEAPDEALPQMPWSGGTDWVFLDLPAFPRETRLMVLRPGGTLRRLLIDRPDAPHLPVQVTAGSRGARVRLRVNGRQEILDLAPGQARELAWDAGRGVAFSRNGRARLRHRFEAEAWGAPVLVRVGPAPAGEADPSRVAWKLDRSRFLEGRARVGQGLASWLAVDALPAAALSFSVEAPPTAGPLRLWIADAQTPHRESGLPLSWNGTVWETSWTHPAEWPFARLRLETTGDGGRDLPWRIRPISGEAPGLEIGRLPAKPGLGAVELRVRRAALEIGDFGFPARLAVGQDLRLRPRMRSRTNWLAKHPEDVLFVHVFDATGRQVWARDLGLALLPDAAADWTVEQNLGPVDLPPGDYDIRAGVYHPRTGVKRDLDRQGSQKSIAGRMILGTLRLENP